MFEDTLEFIETIFGLCVESAKKLSIKAYKELHEIYLALGLNRVWCVLYHRSLWKYFGGFQDYSKMCTQVCPKCALFYTTYIPNKFDPDKIVENIFATYTPQSKVDNNPLISEQIKIVKENMKNKHQAIMDKSPGTIQ